MNLKKTAISIATVSILASVAVTPALAQGTASSSTRLAQREANQQTRITNAQTRANTEIQRRINSLNGLITRINDFKKLSSSSKTTLVSQIQSQISSLTALQTKIDADNDINTLKADVKSIVDSYRIYMLFIPKTHILAAADVILQANQTFTDVESRLQTRITAAQTAGKDVSQLNSLMADMQSKVTDAQTQANAAVNLVTPLQPGADPQAFMPTLQQARTDLQTARHDLDAARQDARNIIQSLKQMKVNTATSSALQKQ